MKQTTSNGIDRTITLVDEANEQFVELMVRDAMASYRRWKTAEEEHPTLRRVPLAKVQARSRGAYQAACRCIAFFAEQPTSYIERYVESRAMEEYDI